MYTLSDMGHNKVIVADTVADVEDLPTYLEPGYVCLVAENSSVYILTPSKEWVEL